jgi:organic hydroperoxide reductase OsmC/OhrA
MSHIAKISWVLADAPEVFAKGAYSRAHQWAFDGGAVVAASSSPSVVPLPFSDPAGVDPEEAFVAALSSCHMLWFLDLARRAGFVLLSYEDAAVGEMAPVEGRLCITRVTLNPKVSWAIAPDAAREAALHHAAHEECFIANSVKTEVVINL